MSTILLLTLVTATSSPPLAGTALTPLRLPASPIAEQQASASPDTTLRDLPAYAFPVRHSPSVEARARVLADRVGSVLDRFGPRLEVRPVLNLLVLAQEDWSVHTRVPIYGLPHTQGGRTLVIAGEDNSFWRSQIPDPSSFPDDVAAVLRRIYDDGSGGVSAAAFFDLLAIHELGHAFIEQSGLETHRRWMDEFLPHLILHAWVEEEAPGLLPALTLLVDLVVAAGPGDHPFTTLAEIEGQYERIAREHPENYAWYQVRWHQGARRVYEAAGTEVLDRLWAALREHPGPLDDATFLAFLDNRVHRALGDVVRNWDAETRSPPPLRLRRDW
jgi:hypothetical protein